MVPHLPLQTNLPTLASIGFFARNANAQCRKRDGARELRRDMTLAVRKLWQVLQEHGLDGCGFRRQHLLGPCIADFECLEAKLVIEVDGGQHHDSQHDVRRDLYLHGKGSKVLRFWNNEVMANLEGVCGVIARHLAERCPHPSLPPHAGERAVQGD